MLAVNIPSRRSWRTHVAVASATLLVASTTLVCAAPSSALAADDNSTTQAADTTANAATSTDSDTAKGTSTKAAKATKTTKKKVKKKKGNCDKFIGLPKSTWVLATGKKRVTVYRKASTSSSRLSSFRKNATIVVDTKGMKQGKNYTWLKVKAKGRGSARGYVKKSAVKLETLDTKTFGLDTSVKKNRTRIAVCQYGLPYLGTRFLMGGASLRGGIDCSTFVRTAMRACGVNVGAYDLAADLATRGKKVSSAKKLQPGDMVFYHTSKSSHISHSAIYLGKGFIINASGHHGKIYPAGGMRISKINYRSPHASKFRNVIS